ncbi:hypothetical protein EIP86_003122 [Pleurotus ostreatoroseus]|nr:hypothetical protein EIP86_003122 [Pleurotus ostreatoroseus]
MTTDISPTQWHSVRPWRPTLSLVVREITSVSATFILSALVHSSADSNAAAVVEQSLASIGLSNLSNDEDGSDGDAGGGPQIVSDVLSKGLSVKVNGTPWQRVLMRVDDEADEAVIILFGLMPGRQYDIELGIVPNEKTLRSQITTITGTDPSLDPGPSDHAHAHAFTLAQPAPHPALSPLTADADGTLAGAEAPSSAPPFSLEDRRLQLAHQLALLTAEHASLTNTLKSARRDAQKADAALRAEIDALRRASERAAPAELRAKQKALALQEAARQALAAAEQVQTRVAELEEALPELTKQRDEVEREWERVRKEADAVHARREEAEAREKKRAEAKQAELAGLVAKLEKLTAKKEKLDGEGGVLGELEERLRRLEEERERVEGDPYGYSYEEFAPEDDDEVVSPTRDRDDSQPSPSGAHRTHSHFHGHHHSHPRKRHTHPSNSNSKAAPAPIGPIQRPAQTRNVGPGNNSSAITLPPGPGVIHLHHAHTGSLPSNTRRPPPPSAPSVAGSTSGSSSSSPSPAHAGASLLSSRAPPFEPRAPNASAKSDLNPGSYPFEPRAGTSSANTSPASKPEGFKKTPGAGRQ